MRKSTVAYKNYGQMPKEPELKEMKIYVGKDSCYHPTAAHRCVGVVPTLSNV